MIEITEEEYKEMKRVAQHVLSSQIVKAVVDRIEAERKPRGYLEEKAELWCRNPHGTHTASAVACVIQGHKADIARIFDEEMDDINQANDACIRINKLKHRICGE